MSTPLNRIENRNLPVKLTDKEHLEYGKSLGEACEKLNAAEAAKKSAVASHGATVAACEANVDMITCIVRTGEVHKDVKCVWDMNHPRAGRKTLFRTDLNEAIDEREMTSDDHQVKMDAVDDEAARESQRVRSAGGDIIVDMRPVALEAPREALGDGSGSSSAPDGSGPSGAPSDAPSKAKRGPYKPRKPKGQVVDADGISGLTDANQERKAPSVDGLVHSEGEDVMNHEEPEHVDEPPATNPDENPVTL